MADKSKSGDQTEKATPKRLRESRKKGDVAKSKDLTATLTLAAWLVIGLMLWKPAFASLNAPFAAALEAVRDPSIYQMQAVGLSALKAFVLVTLMVIAPIAVIGLLTEFVQAGPILTTEKMKPNLDHLNPATGLKRMFSTDNLFEVGKSILKAAAVGLIVWIVVGGQFRKLTALPDGGPSGAMHAIGGALVQLLVTTIVVFALVSSADIAYQRFSFAKKMRMSKREIRQEMKDMEGDPMLRGRRRQLHQEWASRNVVQAARGATALVMNPTHIAVALAYDPEEHPAPVVTAKGMGSLALQMRAAAEEEGVPVIQNVTVARALNARASLDDVIPSDLFAAVAEVIVFARRMRADAQAKAAERAEDEAVAEPMA